jgi:hypothetical protein
MKNAKSMGYILVAAILLAAISLSGTAVGEIKGGEISARMGMLSGFKGHKASGKASITRDDKGNGYLDLTGIKVDKVPDGWVYLAKGGDHTSGVELGILKQFKGDVRFPIPGDVDADAYDSVVIWCKKFDVGIGRAFFDK